MEGSLSTDQLQLAAAPAPLDLSETEPSRKRSLPPTTEGPPKRSKKGKKSKGSSKAVIPELNPSDYVRVVKVTNKDDLLHEGPVLLSKSDKASQMLLSDNRMSVTSSKGYRMVGYDQHSFAYRDLEGVKVHQANREAYAEPFTEGDIIGCLLHMPEGGRAFEKEKSDIVTWKGELYFVDEPTADPAKLEGSLVAFTKNGQTQGIAYRVFIHTNQPWTCLLGGACRLLKQCPEALLQLLVCEYGKVIYQTMILASLGLLCTVLFRPCPE
ncbi:TPA: hypothetical protein ACH3X3_001407 [Trebouxia sp. C0006]